MSVATAEQRADVSGRWTVLAYAWAVIVALGLAYFVVRIPVQRSDGLANLFQVQEGSWYEVAKGGIASGYMRPALWLQIKLAFQLADGNYTAVFRAIHAVQIVACGLLFVGALRVRDRAALCAVPFGLALLFGSHTFDGTIREAYPINTYLTIVVACLAAFNLSQGRPAWWRDVAAVAVFVLALFTVETGVLVGVVFAVMWAAGARGVSRRALLCCAAALAVYGLGRVMLLGGATPGLSERVSGFGFRALEPQELQARFGAFPYLFYLYNITSQVLTVLLSEPSGGILAFTASVLAGEVRPAHVIYTATILASTGLIVAFVVSRWAAWRRYEFSHGDRLVLVFLGLLLVNALVSFPYTKDVIMSPAGGFYALAASVAVCHQLYRLADVPRLAVVRAVVMLMLLGSAAAIRLMAVHYQMRAASFVTRNDWTELDAWARNNQIDLTMPGRAALTRQLFNDAINRRTPAPRFTEREAGMFRRLLF
jgi:hypothetical protein